MLNIRSAVFKHERTVDRRATSIMLLLGVGVPNIPFLLAQLTGIGTPPRSAGILLHVLAVVVGRVYGKTALLIGIVVAFLADMTLTVASLFGFFIGDLPQTLQFANEVDFFAAPFYAGISIVLGTTLIATFVLASHTHRKLKTGSLGTLLTVTACLMLVDYVANHDPHYGIGRVMAKGTAVQSAISESGFESALLHREMRHRVVVMVEGLGVHEDTASTKAILAPLTRAAAADNRVVTQGVIPYYGSTKEGELRELCGTRKLFTEFTVAPDSSCVLFRAAARGYRAIGIHGYSGAMFDRDQWWMNVGLSTQVFAEDLQSLPQCGKAFAGACDTAIVQKIGALLKATDKPQVIFFLTLNTHIPITPGQHSTPSACVRQGWLGIDNLCHLNRMWHDLFRQLATLVADPELTGVDLLVVGDHAPPLWSRKERRQFKAGVVPWIRIAAQENRNGEY